jgi:cytochrome c oxidase cbb3-type subunit 4
MSSLGHSIWTVVVFIVFIGIVLWAYSGSRKKDFDEAAMLALDDDETSISKQSAANKPASNKQKTEE